MKRPVPVKTPNTNTVKVRDARETDINAMVSLLRELFAIEADFAFDEKRQRKGLSLMVADCQKHRCVKVAEIESSVVGMCTAQTLISTARGGVVALVEDMVVSEKYRRMGIGHQLMESIEKWAQTRGANRLQLLADRTNFSALDFYDRMGWLPTRLICLRKKWK